MTQQDKDPLIKDLCTRLPYKVCIDIYGCINTLTSIDHLAGDKVINHVYVIDEVKPYLFPMSSMTEKQKKEVYDLGLHICFDEKDKTIGSKWVIDGWGYSSVEDYTIIIDWLNEHHFDYRGLIDKDLALDATNLNIYE